MNLCGICQVFLLYETGTKLGPRDGFMGL